MNGIYVATAWTGFAGIGELATFVYAAAILAHLLTLIIPIILSVFIGIKKNKKYTSYVFRIFLNLSAFNVICVYYLFHYKRHILECRRDTESFYKYMRRICNSFDTGFYL